MGASPRSKKSRQDTGPAWVALDDPLEFTTDNGITWIVQDYNKVADMFLCERKSRGQKGQLIVLIARGDQVIEHVGLVPGIRSRVRSAGLKKR